MIPRLETVDVRQAAGQRLLHEIVGTFRIARERNRTLDKYANSRRYDDVVCARSDTSLDPACSSLVTPYQFSPEESAHRLRTHQPSCARCSYRQAALGGTDPRQRRGKSNDLPDPTRAPVRRHRVESVTGRRAGGVRVTVAVTPVAPPGLTTVYTPFAVFVQVDVCPLGAPDTYRA